MTTGRGGDDAPAAGGPARHIPVLLDEVLTALRPETGGLFLDGTFGAGGYTRAILARPNTRVLALDRDPDAIANGQDLVREMQGRMILEHARFGDLAEVAARLGLSGFAGVTLDVGVSSMQLDQAARGFSFRADGPLDMRMEQSGRSAADIVNEADEEELAGIIFHYGEERASRKIARAIVHDRKATPFTTTRQLASLLERILPSKPTEIHPATRTFQALRIAVNDELGELVRALAGAEALLAPGGRLAIVSFHSLEDRIVKQFLGLRMSKGRGQSRLLPGETAPPPATFERGAKEAIVAGAAETKANPRARSAKLRVAIRNDVRPQGLDPAIAALAALPSRDPRRH